MNHLFRRQRLELTVLVLLCLGLLCRPQAAAQGFADGARLCVGSLLPALFPFMVVCELLAGLPLPTALLRPLARLLGLQSKDAAAALLAAWLGGYAVCPPDGTAAGGWPYFSPGRCAADAAGVLLRPRVRGGLYWQSAVRQHSAGGTAVRAATGGQSVGSRALPAAAAKGGNGQKSACGFCTR